MAISHVCSEKGTILIYLLEQKLQNLINSWHTGPNEDLKCSFKEDTQQRKSIHEIMYTTSAIYVPHPKVMFLCSKNFSKQLLHRFHSFLFQKKTKKQIAYTLNTDIQKAQQDSCFAC